MSKTLILAASMAVAVAQQVGNWIPEVHPRFTTWQCTNADGCKAQNTSLAIDVKSRWMHIKGGTMSCTGNDRSITNTYCYDAESCHNNCVYEGADYKTNGVYTSNNGTYDNYVEVYMNPNGSRTTPRVYLLDETEQNYQRVQLGPGTEFTYETDVSHIVQGTAIGAVYAIGMNFDGGRSEFNEAGPAYGTGYCDAQCHIRDFYNGVPNLSSNYGSCCAELDFFEGSRGEHSGSAHPCKLANGSVLTTPYPCKGKECEHSPDGGMCSHRACGIHNYDSNAKLYGPGKGYLVDTSRPFTMVTQFLSAADIASENKKYAKRSGLSTSNVIADAQEASGDMIAMREVYVQDGKVIAKSNGKTGAFAQTGVNACADGISYQAMALAGGFPAMGKTLAYGMVLSFSIFGTATDGETRIGVRNVRWGELGSTYHADGSDW